MTENNEQPTTHNGEAAAEWLALFGADPAAAARFPFAPTTLKTVLSGALDLGRAAGRLPEAMRVLGEGEGRLAALAARLGLDRRAGTVGGRPFPTGVVVTGVDASGVRVMGRWGPDVLERAGVAPLGPASGDVDQDWSWEELAQAAPDVVVLAAGGGALHAGGPDAGAAGAAARIPEAVPGVRVVGVEAALVNRPGPALVRTVERVADAVHGATSF